MLMAAARKNNGRKVGLTEWQLKSGYNSFDTKISIFIRPISI